ncbi:MAG: YidC/Oxa1 family membrane protein insertase [Patescibacteria group bacterium]
MEALKVIFYEPLYNGLIFLVSVIPGADLGVAVIFLTLLVKCILFPVSHKSSRAQAGMKAIEPEVKALQEKHKNNKEELAKKTMELYRTRGVNPFSGCLPILIQFPVIIALYFVFYKGLAVSPELAATFPSLAGHINGALLDKSALYSFVHMPEYVKTNFLGFIDMTGKSMLLAVLAGASQYFQMKRAFPDTGGFPKRTGSWKDDFGSSMAFQMRYIMPVMVLVFAYTISAAVALYWSVSNIFTLAQEEIIRKKIAAEAKKP